MSINTQKSRERIKRSTLTGVVPTVPVSSDFTDGTWLNTDIRAGEFFYNIPDEKLWIGTNTVPLELTSSIGNTLAQILANGNTTGASDIIVTAPQIITSSNINSGTIILDNGSGQMAIGNNSGAQSIFFSPGYSNYNHNNTGIQLTDNQISMGLFHTAGFGLTNDTLGATFYLQTPNVQHTGTIQLRSNIDITGTQADYAVTLSTSDNTTTAYSALQLGQASDPTYVSLQTFDGTNLNDLTIDSASIIGSASNVIGFNINGNSSSISIRTASGPNPEMITLGGDCAVRINTFTGLGVIPIPTNGDFQAYVDGNIKFYSKYNTTITDVLSISNTFSTTLTTLNNINPGMIIGSQNSTIAAGVYNSLIIGGNNNQINAGLGNLISGNVNINTAGNNNFITGYLNTNTSGSFNIIGGSDNINTSGGDNIISGSTNINTSGNNNFISGQNNINIIGDANIIGGLYNSNNSSFWGNIISGTGNECYTYNSLLIGSNNIMTNPGIMYGLSGASTVSNGFSNAYVNTINATPTLLTTDGTNSFKILTDQTFRVELTLLVKNINTGDAKEWKGFGIIKNVAGTTSLVGGTLTMTSTIGDVSLATTSVAVTANNTTDCLDITVTGIAATNILWNCGIEYVLVNG